jgi:iron complex outermembrane receptor protein
LFDLGAAYTTEFGNQRLTFRINGENITDEDYWVSTGNLLLAQGAPATVKFSIETSF